MTFDQVQQLWIQNGGDPAWAPLMAGIAMAESGGNTQALNNTPATGDYSVGLWQINYYAGLRPGRTAEYGSPEALLADPNKQAKAAISLFGQNGAGLSNWTNDATWNAWVRAGRPQAPSAALVKSWGVGGGTSGDSVPAAGGTTLDSSSTSSPADPRMCGAKGGGVDILFGHIGTACQIKALTGGLLIGLGGAVLVVGVIILSGRSRTVQGAVQGGAKGAVGGPAGAVAGGAVGAATAAPKAKVAAPKAPAVEPEGPSEDYGRGWVDGVESMLGGGAPPPKNTRQANRQAEDVFDSLGISSPGPASQRNSLGNELPF